MKILFLRFPLKPAWGGAETQALALASGLRERGHEVFLLSNDRRLVNAFAKSGLPAKKSWIGWEPTSKIALLLFPLTSLIGFFVLSFWINKIEPAAVISTTLADKLLATPMAKMLGKKSLWIEHTRLGRWLYKNPFLFWYRLQSKDAKIVAPSYFLRNQLIQAGVPVDNITVIYPGISLRHSDPPVAEKNLKRSFANARDDDKARKFVIGYLGRLTKEKGVDVLLKTIATIDNPAVIAGAGPEEQALKKLAEKLDLDDRVKFLGEISNKRDFFSQINCLVVPSVEAESFGLVIIEAMTAGVPVIASRIGATGEIIEHKKTGLLFEPGNVEELAKKIKFLRDNPTARTEVVKLAKTAVIQRFSAEKMILGFLNLVQ
ncbi:MAG: glycosyltransferase family 4 protein [Patescibacteria group bacterium]